MPDNILHSPDNMNSIEKVWNRISKKRAKELYEADKEWALERGLR